MNFNQILKAVFQIFTCIVQVSKVIHYTLVN